MFGALGLCSFLVLMMCLVLVLMLCLVLVLGAGDVLGARAFAMVLCLSMELCLVYQ